MSVQKRSVLYTSPGEYLHLREEGFVAHLVLRARLAPRRCSVPQGGERVNKLSNLGTVTQLAAVGVVLVACASGTEATTETARASECEPASSAAVENIRGLLAADPSAAESLGEGAQQVAVQVPFGGAESEVQSLIGGALEPTGAIGVWGALYLNGSFIAIQPVNDVAIQSMPGVATMTPAAESTRSELLASEAVAQLIACVE